MSYLDLHKILITTNINFVILTLLTTLTVKLFWQCSAVLTALGCPAGLVHFDRFCHLNFFFRFIGSFIVFDLFICNSQVIITKVLLSLFFFKSNQLTLLMSEMYLADWLGINQLSFSLASDILAKKCQENGKNKPNFKWHRKFPHCICVLKLKYGAVNT